MEAGELDQNGDNGSGDASSWPLMLAIAGVLLVGLVVGIVALSDSGPSIDAATAGTAPQVSSTTGVTPTSGGGPTTSVTRTTSPPTSSPPTSSPPTTAPPTSAPPTTSPPTTVPPTTPPTTVPPDEWVLVSSSAGGFSAMFPTEPNVSAPLVSVDGSQVARIEYDVDGPSQSKLAVTSYSVPDRTASVDAVLDSAVDRMRIDLGGALTVDRDTVAGVPARTVTMGLRGGTVRALLLFSRERLITASMFKPSAAGASADTAYDRMAGSVALG